MASSLRSGLVFALCFWLSASAAGALPLAEEPSPAAAEESVRSADTGGTAIEHRLLPGQTMAAVARFYAVPLASVVEANPNLEPTRLEVGQILRVPEPPGGWPQMSIEAGASASSLASAGGYALAALRLLNPGVDLERLSTGQSLRVPRLVPAVAGPGAPSAANPSAADVTVPPAPGSLPPGALALPPRPSLPPPAAAELPARGWEMVTLADGRKAWAPRAQMMVPALVPLTRPQLIELAQKFMGAPYVWGGQTPNGVDCSGYVQEVYRLGGHALPRLADEQYQRCLPVDAPQPGDLVFFSTYLPGPSHVGISLGGDRFLHASSSRGVIEASLTDSYFASRYLGARRPVTLEPASTAATQR